MTPSTIAYPPSVEFNTSLQSHWTKIESSKSPNNQEECDFDEDNSEFSFEGSDSTMFIREDIVNEHTSEVKKEESIEEDVKFKKELRGSEEATVQEQVVDELKSKVNYYKLNFHNVSEQLAAERNQARSVIHYLQKIVKDLEEEKEMNSVADLREGNLKVDLFSDEYWAF